MLMRKNKSLKYHIKFPDAPIDHSRSCTVAFQLIEGASAQQKEGLGIMTPDYYYYLNQSGTYKVDGTNDSKDYQETMVRIH